MLLQSKCRRVPNLGVFGALASSGHCSQNWWFDCSRPANNSAGLGCSNLIFCVQLSSFSTLARSSGSWLLRPVDLGRYCRSEPLVFSYVYGCRTLARSQELMRVAIAFAMTKCLAISQPWFNVRDHLSARGTCLTV